MRTFTVAEANALIPRIEELFARLRRIREESRPSQEELTRIDQGKRSNGVDHTEEVRALRGRLDAVIEEMNSILRQIADLGCEIKDVEQGLVDFPCQRGERIVYLCWKSGEDRIGFWHEISAGFAGRQPLTGDEP